MDGKNGYNRALYWRKARRFTLVLVALWFGATFGIVFFARELMGFTVFGWPFSFYMAAQGLALLYLTILAAYVAYMRRLDRLLKHEDSHAP